MEAGGPSGAMGRDHATPCERSLRCRPSTGLEQINNVSLCNDTFLYAVRMESIRTGAIAHPCLFTESCCCSPSVGSRINIAHDSSTSARADYGHQGRGSAAPVVSGTSTALLRLKGKSTSTAPLRLKGTSTAPLRLKGKSTAPLRLIEPLLSQLLRATSRTTGSTRAVDPQPLSRLRDSGCGPSTV